MDKPTVFIGSSGKARATAELVKTELSSVAEPVLWHDPSFFRLSSLTFETLTDALDEDKFDFAVLLFTPDDDIVIDGESKKKPRNNVLIEFGLFAGALGRERTYILMPSSRDEGLDIGSDLEGFTVAPLDPCEDVSVIPDQHCYAVARGCARIAQEIKSRWRRRHLKKEVGVLYRLVNAMAYPHYDDIIVPALRKSGINYRLREKFDTVEEVIDFLGELLTEYVYSQLPIEQLETMRVTFAYYLGDGVADLPKGTDPRVCYDTDINGNEISGEFVTGLANPTSATADKDWRIGRVTKGFSGMFPESMTAKIFLSGDSSGFNDSQRLADGIPNYEVPDERAFFGFPVEWRSENGIGSVGVLTISSRRANMINEDIKTIVNLVAKIAGFLFSICGSVNYGMFEEKGAVILNSSATMRGFTKVAENKAGKRFVAAVTGLRRSIAGNFENKMFAKRRHQLVDGVLRVSDIAPENK